MSDFDPLQSPVLRRELPGLATAFDESAMREHLEQALFDPARTGYAVAACEVDQATYAPGEGVILRYQLELRPGDGGATRQALVSGRLFPDQAACSVYVSERLAPLVAQARGRDEIGPFAAPVAVLEPLHMAVHAFPLDAELPTLIGATDRARVADVLRDRLPAALDERFEIDDCQVELVDYGRQYRATLRYRLAGHAPGGAAERKMVVYGKLTGDGSGAMAGEISAALRDRAARGDYHFAVPRVLDWQSDLRLSLLEAIPGEPVISDVLKARLKGKAVEGQALSLEEMLDVCARIAATLHRSQLALGPRRSLETDLAALGQRFAEVERVSPDLGGQLQTWLKRLAPYAAGAAAVGLAFCHGDFTFGQVLFDGASSGLVDFDSVCQAEPALDLGHFLVYLQVAGAKKATDSSRALIDGLTARFLDSYRAAAGLRADDAEQLQARVSAYKTMSLLRRALRSWQKFKPGRVESAMTALEDEIERLP